MSCLCGFWGGFFQHCHKVSNSMAISKAESLQLSVQVNKMLYAHCLHEAFGLGFLCDWNF